jgi:hypothetical protein
MASHLLRVGVGGHEGVDILEIRGEDKRDTDSVCRLIY